MKKVLSLVLVIAMVLSSMSFAFASTFEDIADSDHAVAIETMKALGVIDGFPDGTFGPELNLTRAQLAKLLVEALGFGGLAGGASNFSDTNGHWADGYIAIATGMGIVNGYPDGTFQPEGNVTYAEAYSMVIRALGYTPESLRGVWPTNYLVKALELGLTDGLASSDGYADRGSIAQMLFNALEAVLVTVDSDNKITNVKDSKDNNVILLSRLAELDEDFDVTVDTIDEDSKFFAAELLDLEPYLFQNLQVYLNDDDQVVYVKDTNSLVMQGILNAAGDVTATLLTVEDADEDDNKFDITTKSAFMVNGVVTDLDNLKYEGSNVKVTVVLDAEADDKVVDGLDVIGVVAVKATAEKIVAREYVAGRTRFDGINLPVDSDDDVDMDKIIVEGAVDSLEEIAKDSVVTVYAGLNADNKVKEIRLVVSENVIEGKITRASHDKGSVTIGGTAYSASAFADKTSVVIGETGTLYLNAEGKFLEFVSEDAKEVGDYAVVVSRSNGEYDEFLDANEKDAKVKLATAANKEIIYSLAEGAEIDGVELVAKADGTIDIVAVLAKDLVVEYSLDKDGKIEWIEEVTFDKIYTGATLDTDTKAFIVADEAVIFDGYTTDKYQVLNTSQLADKIAAKVVYNEDGEIELLFVTVGVETESTGTFAVINNVEVAVNDDNDTVYLITAYIDGERVSYYTNKKFYSDNPGASALRTALRGGFKLNELTMDGDVITKVTTEGAFSADVVYEGKVVSVKAANDVFTIIKENNATEVLVLADDAIVYLQTGAAVVEVEDIYELDADNVDKYADAEGDLVKVYDTDKDGEIDIVIIKQR